MKAKKEAKLIELEYMRVGDAVEVRARGTAKEIASLVLELQRKPERLIQVGSKTDSPEERKELADTISAILTNQARVHSSEQPPDPTSPEPKQDAESLRK